VTSSKEPVLETRELTAFYSDFQALFGISFVLNEGETVAIIGANGAGKSTFLKSISGLLPRPPSAVRLDGRDIGALPAYEVVKLGIALVPEGRRLFSSLSVEENLLVGAYGRRDGGPWNLAAVYRLFPILQERRHAPSTTLSGGQQQMVAIGRGLAAGPQYLLLDEPSLGLAPLVVASIFEQVKQLSVRNIGILIVEQNATAALSAATSGYLLESGAVADSGPDLLDRPELTERYFGVRGVVRGDGAPAMAAVLGPALGAG